LYCRVSEISSQIKIGKMKSTLREDQYVITTSLADNVKVVNIDSNW
jgi:hypothetical protein